MVFFRKFRVVSVCFSLFETVLFASVVSYRFKTPKQTETNRKFLILVSRNNNPNTTETALVSVCFCSNRNFFVCFKDTLVASFPKVMGAKDTSIARGHITPIQPFVLLSPVSAGGRGERANKNCPRVSRALDFLSLLFFPISLHSFCRCARQGSMTKPVSEGGTPP